MNLFEAGVISASVGSALADLLELRYLETARFYPRSEFDVLKAAHPNLKCQWFDK